jgi:ABC-type Mn2+/Zn2+ transport system permease subunit
LILTALVVAFSIKIFWILLLGAFLILPSNIWKILANSIKKVFVFSLIVSLIWVNIWLFASYYLNTATWATIVLVLAIILIISIMFKKYAQ